MGKDILKTPQELINKLDRFIMSRQIAFEAHQKLTVDRMNQIQKLRHVSKGLKNLDDSQIINVLKRYKPDILSLAKYKSPSYTQWQNLLED
jgi:hypothetical protein